LLDSHDVMKYHESTYLDSVLSSLSSLCYPETLKDLYFRELKVLFLIVE
jgi:hypothetical protein